MLKKIKIRGYKSLADVDIELNPLTVLFGPNAAGKSNFLDALQLLSGMATSRTLKEAFEPPYRGKPLESFTFGDDGIKGLLARKAVSFCFEADIELSNSVIDGVNRQILEMKKTSPSRNSKKRQQSFVREKFLRYRIEVEIIPGSGILRVADEFLGALNKKGEISLKRAPFIVRKGDRLHLRMERQAHPIYYARRLDHSILSLPMHPPHYPHLVAIRQELARWLFYYFEPRERMRTPTPVKEVRRIGLMGEELASFLNTLRAIDEPQFKTIEKALQMIAPSITGIEVGPNDLGEVELTLMEGKMPVPARVLSEGTLRMLGLLALGGAKDPPALLGFEEPENGIHPRRIPMIADILKNRAAMEDAQLIITTHSPILPDLFSGENLLVCRKENGRTRMDPFFDYGPLGRYKGDKATPDSEESFNRPVSERIQRGDFDA